MEYAWRQNNDLRPQIKDCLHPKSAHDAPLVQIPYGWYRSEYACLEVEFYGARITRGLLLESMRGIAALAIHFHRKLGPEI